MSAATSMSPAQPLLAVSGLVKRYPLAHRHGAPRHRARRHRAQRTPREVQAVDGVSFAVAASETLGLVGETGCGKSTIARILAGLLAPTAGSVVFAGEEIANASRARRRALTRAIQMTFQDPYASLNPSRAVGAIVAEPLVVHRLAHGRHERARRVAELMELVGLDARLMPRQPHELSGGQRQRVGLARALALGPRLLIADEPVSALDLQAQAQVLGLLRDLKDRLGLTLLLISHDLAVVRQACDRVAVMRAGRIVELASAEAIYSRAAHPYTRSLLAAVPALARGERPAATTAASPGMQGP